MNKHKLSYLSWFIIIGLLFPSLVKAESDLSAADAVYQYLQSAFQAQVSLSEEYRSLQEINEILTPYFTEDYNKEFLDENLFLENGKYITYGSDFAFYFIPFFSYTEETRVVRSEENIYVYEFFPETDEGPVSYESHYEGIRLDKLEGEWKIASFLYNEIPEEVIQQSEKAPVAVPKESQMSFRQLDLVKSTMQIGLFLHPLETFYKYGSGLLAKQAESK
ncbi:DUF3993 domain-containing protein [Cytobacillus sp. FJAT-53684]|uniref:DUF3993 domain-containing protein n=1 Tax=Cytobacillus mangrovibacter TaxID=3299024 RepID=A0ABW6JU39_9BACI